VFGVDARKAWKEGVQWDGRIYVLVKRGEEGALFVSRETDLANVDETPCYLKPVRREVECAWDLQLALCE
jgi:hypothetical protein